MRCDRNGLCIELVSVCVEIVGRMRRVFVIAVVMQMAHLSFSPCGPTQWPAAMKKIGWVLEKSSDSPSDRSESTIVGGDSPKG
jgi:hypothetical protein